MNLSTYSKFSLIKKEDFCLLFFKDNLGKGRTGFQIKNMPDCVKTKFATSMSKFWPHFITAFADNLVNFQLMDS